MAPALPAYLARQTKAVDRALNRFLPPAGKPPRVIHEAMRYSVFAGGKRLRPMLVIAAAEACGSRATRVMPAACALELVHTYSLVHDDLPAMDDDDLRRGRPTSHKVYGEGTAILVGDALLTLAFRLLSENGRLKGVTAAAVADAVRILALNAGSEGMVGGQAADVEWDGARWKRLNSAKRSDFNDPGRLLDFIHRKKTAALISASLEIGARLAGGQPVQIAALRRAGEAIGVAFQVRDDILDRIGDKKKLGKRGSDEANQKLTYPALYGMNASERTARRLVSRARRALSIFGRKGRVLNELADYALSRDF